MHKLGLLVCGTMLALALCSGAAWAADEKAGTGTAAASSMPSKEVAGGKATNEGKPACKKGKGMCKKKNGANKLKKEKGEGKKKGKKKGKKGKSAE